MSIWSTLKRRASVAICLVCAGSAAPIASAQTGNFGIENESDYQDFKLAVRSAQYVLEDYIVGHRFDICPDDGDPAIVASPGTKPRVVGVVAGTLAFIERNPSVGSEAILEFLNAYDAALKAAAPEDTDLLRPSNFLHAVRFARVRSDIDDTDLNNIVGADTDIGERTLELLGVTVPGPDGFVAVRNRQVRHQRATTRDYGNRPEFGTLLVHAFLDQDASGNEAHEDLSTHIRDFLNAEGYQGLETTRTELCAINTAIDALPASYSDYIAALETPLDYDASDGVDNPHQARLILAINDAFGLSDDLIDQITDVLADEPSLYESIDLAGDQTYIDMVIAELADDLRATSGPRANSAANAMMLMQGRYNGLGDADYVEKQLGVASAVIGINAKYAYATSAVRIAGSFAVLSVSTDPATGWAAATDIVCESINIAATADNGVTDDDIYSEIREMRQQLIDMQTQLNQRFDRIEAQLDVMYDTMVAGLEALGEQIGDLTEDVNDLVRDVYVVQSQLSRMEEALFGVAQETLLQQFMRDCNIYLGFRGDAVSDLPYDVGSPNFRNGALYMYGFATSDAKGSSFAGSQTNPFALNMADETVGSGPIARYINDLVVNTSAFGIAPLSSQVIVGPEPWAQGVSAYTRLAHENPWYFAYAYQTQFDAWQGDPDGTSPPELDQMIDAGEDLLDVMEAARDPDLFDALVNNYKAAAADLQTAIDDAVVELLENNAPIPLANDDVVLDLWQGGDIQGVRDLSPRLDRWIATWGDDEWILDNPRGEHEGWRGYRSISRTSDRSRRSLLLSLLMANENDGQWREAYWYNQVSGTDQWLIAELPLGDEIDGAFSVQRSLRYKWFARVGSDWVEIDASDNEQAAQWVRRMWPLFQDDLNSGSEMFMTYSDGDRQINFIEEQVVGRSFDQLDEDIAERLTRIRSNSVRPGIIALMGDASTDLFAAAQALNDAEAVLDAYVTLALPQAFEVSEVLSSALRSVPGNSELGLRSADVVALIQDFTAADNEDDQNWGDPNYDLPSVEDILGVRIDEVHDEITRALNAADTDAEPEAAAYVEWMLAEARSLRNDQALLAIDDLFTADNRLFRGPSILDNDVWQSAGFGAFRPVEIDPDFGPGDEGYLAPENAELVLYPDGTFILIIDEGYNGRNTFTYRLRCDISDDGLGAYAYSEPAYVVVKFPTGSNGGTIGDDSQPAPPSVTRTSP